MRTNTRKKVLNRARDLGYRTNTFAGNLRTQRTNTIGLRTDLVICKPSPVHRQAWLMAQPGRIHWNPAASAK